MKYLLVAFSLMLSGCAQTLWKYEPPAKEEFLLEEYAVGQVNANHNENRAKT